MLYWKANFSIPNSGTQAAEVFVNVVSEEDGGIVAEFYCDPELTHMLFNKKHTVPSSVTNYEDYLLTLEEYSTYTKI